MGQRFKAKKNQEILEEMKRKGDPYADCYYIKNNGSLGYDKECWRLVQENLIEEQVLAKQKARIELEYKKTESERKLQEMREANVDPFIDCYWINESGDLVKDQFCVEVRLQASMTYVDLGLPSGTLWGMSSLPYYYTYDEALFKFGNQLPTQQQFVELKDNCTWSWKEWGYEVIGPNGNSIYLVTLGSYDCDDNYVTGVGGYWSSTSYDSDNVYHLYFYSGALVYIGPSFHCHKQSVCLVQ